MSNALQKTYQCLQGICSYRRIVAVVIKEFRQLLRDRMTFVMIVAIPLMQLILFGFAINTNPKNLPTTVVSADHSEFTRTLIAGLKNTGYFKITNEAPDEKIAREMLATGKTQFVVTIPSDFTRKLMRNEKPQILVEADATDPVATGSALSAVQILGSTVFANIFHGQLDYLNSAPYSVQIVTHANYNPEAITKYNIVPGLLGVVLTMTLVMIASMGITKEREQGTMEYLLSTPVRAMEVILGKVTPYIIIGYLQMILILLAARFIFFIPIEGSVALLFVAALPFILANSSVGMVFSSFAKTQLQSAQMTVFFFLPSMLLTGFMFPYRGMPEWAQYVGGLLPLTYFLRIVRGIVLKGNGIKETWTNLWPIMVFLVVAIFAALKRYHRTLD
jgi:ABC-2 type transport system permease protein